MPRTSLAYRALLRTASVLAPLGGLVNEKFARTIALRRGVGERLAAWGRRARDPSRPLAWFHAPSVGEGLQARTVLQEFRARHPDWQVAYTYFSPSAESFAAGIGADIADCLPIDTPEAVNAALDALRPSLLVFAKLDVWPELATGRRARACPWHWWLPRCVQAADGSVPWRGRSWLRVTARSPLPGRSVPMMPIVWRDWASPLRGSR